MNLRPLRSLFIFEMKGSFKKGLIPKGKDEVKKVEEEPGTISNSLVPIVEMKLIAMLLSFQRNFAQKH